MRVLLFAVALCLALPASASELDRGVAAFKARDYARAAELWQPLAEAGDADGQYNLALLYANGLGVPRDHTRAARLYQTAAEQGHADAQYNLGLMHARGEGVWRSNLEAKRYWEMAALQNHPAAQFNLGLLHAYGLGTQRDITMAIQLWRRAAGQGNRDAMHALAEGYAGRVPGFPQDEALSQEWRERAAP